MQLKKRSCIFRASFQFTYGAKEKDEDKDELAGVLPEEASHEGCEEDGHGS
jgi:hypothetical protein